MEEKQRRNVEGTRDRKISKELQYDFMLYVILNRYNNIQSYDSTTCFGLYQPY
jgi:hypothetical protein